MEPKKKGNPWKVLLVILGLAIFEIAIIVAIMNKP